jgi:DNA-directed RNA polymerase subunit RPC12/RpoP
MEAIEKRLEVPYEPGMDLEAYVCLACGSSFDPADVNECTSCGTPFFSNDETGVCPDCEDRWKEE